MMAMRHDAGRARPRRLAAAAAAAGMAVVLAGCGGPSSVALAELARDHAAYEGQTVVVRGVVVEFGSTEGVPQHAVLQDPDAHRVELVPFERAEPHLGSAVTVTGTFEFVSGRGRLLHIDSIEAASGGAVSS